MTRPLLEPEQDEIKKALWDDATADRYDTFFYAAFTGDLLPKLNVKLDRNFIPGTDYYMHWDKEEKKGYNRRRIALCNDTSSRNACILCEWMV